MKKITGNSYTSFYLHIVFSTKHHIPYLIPEIRTRLIPNMGGIAKQNGLKLIKGGGTLDHLHILISLIPAIAIAKAVQYLKGGSSYWIHRTFPILKNFEWQKVYGAFSVSIKQIDQIVSYIENQEEHHRIKTYKEEFIELLKIHKVNFDDKFLL